MRKKLIICVVTILAITSVIYPSFAYRVGLHLPGRTTYVYTAHSSLNSSMITAVRAAATTWNSTNDGLYLNYGFGSTGTISWTDSRNDIFSANFQQIGLPSSAIGATIFLQGDFETFDLGINSVHSYGTGSGESYFDLQGLFTHELGHVWGLLDLFLSSPEVLGKTRNNVPTMYGMNSFDGTNNIYYYLRTLESDDIAGKAYIASLIN